MIFPCRMCRKLELYEGKVLETIFFRFFFHVILSIFFLFHSFHCPKAAKKWRKWEKKSGWMRLKQDEEKLFRVRKWEFIAIRAWNLSWTVFIYQSSFSFSIFFHLSIEVRLKLVPKNPSSPSLRMSSWR